MQLAQLTMKILSMALAPVVACFLFTSCTGRQTKDNINSSSPPEASVGITAIPTNEPTGENLIPDPGFEQPENKAWEGSPAGCVVLDATVAETGTNSYCLKVSPEQNLVHLNPRKPLKLNPWSWYEVSYSYRTQPPVRFDFFLHETTTNGYRYCRSRRVLNYRQAKPDEFLRVALRFLTRSEPSDFRLIFNAYCGSTNFLPGMVWIDNIALRFVAAATKADPKELKLLDGSFENPMFTSGYDYHQSYKTELSPDAKHGQRVLKKGDDRKDGAFIISLVHPEEVSCGHLYRASIWARGEGTCYIESSDWDCRDAMKRFPLDPKEWRQVSADFLVDGPSSRVSDMRIRFSGNVEFDDARFIRLQ